MYVANSWDGESTAVHKEQIPFLHLTRATERDNRGKDRRVVRLHYVYHAVFFPFHYYPSDVIQILYLFTFAIEM